jgi:hypothetical protein
MTDDFLSNLATTSDTGTPACAHAWNASALSTGKSACATAPISSQSSEKSSQLSAIKTHQEYARSVLECGREAAAFHSDRDNL